MFNSLNTVTQDVATLDPNYVTRGIIKWIKKGNVCTVIFEDVFFQNVNGYSATPFASNLPLPISLFELPILQYNISGIGWVQVDNVNGVGILRPDGYLASGIATWGSFTYVCQS